MAREAISKRLHEEFKRWLEYKGLNSKDVRTNYVIHSEGGYTEITFTMIANDFPVPTGSLVSEDEPPACTFHTDCGPECPTDETPSV